MSFAQCHTASERERTGLKSHPHPQPLPYLTSKAPRSTKFCDPRVKREKSCVAQLQVTGTLELVSDLHRLPLQSTFVPTCPQNRRARAEPWPAERAVTPAGIGLSGCSGWVGLGRGPRIQICAEVQVMLQLLVRGTRGEEECGRERLLPVVCALSACFSCAAGWKLKRQIHQNCVQTTCPWALSDDLVLAITESFS